MNLEDDRKQRDAAAARAMWEDLARQARVLHCPEHFAEPWRVAVLGETPQNYRLYISGCCEQLRTVVNQMINSDPRIAGPR